MNQTETRKQTKYLHEGNYVAQLEIELTDSNNEWSPTMSLETAYLLDDIRLALRHKDIKTASKHATVFEMKQIA